MTHHHPPLAERMRPQSIEEIVGQQHLLAKGAPIYNILSTQFLPSMILYGDAGIGKTTLAKVLAKQTLRPFFSLSAVHDGVASLKKILQSPPDLLQSPPVVFIDEIHRFNKAQQDALLPAVEVGEVCLIGATTENPSFSVNNALLSRCQVYELLALDNDDINALMYRALKDDVLKQYDIDIKSTDAIYKLSNGDARRALNLLELCVLSQPKDGAVVDDAHVYAVAGQHIPHHDKDGDNHYDLISALIKSVRGSDADAALYWLARLLIAGEDAAFIARRLVILASEDIGLANPNALLLADTALRSVQSIGMPEARIILGQVTVYLATSAKSNTSYKAINEAMICAKHTHAPVPLHLKNATTKLAKQKGFGADYVYPHDYPNHYHTQDYLPTKLLGTTFYHFGDNAKEQKSLQFMNWLKSQ